MKIALIQAQWHQDLVEVAVQACTNTLLQNNVSKSAIHTYTVPGSLEIPLFAKKCIQAHNFSAIIAFGLVVDGGIYRHEFVAQAILNGFMQVSLETGTPIFSCVLTPQAFHEHQDHHNFFKNHLDKKGNEAALSCIDFLKAIQELA